MNRDEILQSNGPDRLAADFSHVLIVGRSQINKVVVSKIVERSGLKPLAEMPESAGKVLHQVVPGTIILDGGSDNRDCDGVIEHIVGLRRASGKNAPLIILLSNRTGDIRSLSLSSAVDAVVAKPITPERLQPVVEQMVMRGRR